VKVRRSLVLALVLSLLTPLGAEAQSLEKSLPRIGYLSVGSESHREAAFRQGLRDLGYIDGKNITIEYRFAEGDDNRLSGFASELVRLNVNIIVVSSSQAIQAAQQATQVVPIVMALSGDIGETGAVASLARPGGNMTGLTTTSPELSGKRLALLKEAVPKLSRVAVLVNPRNPIAAIQLRATEPAGRGLGLQIQVLEAKGPDEFEKAFQAAARTGGRSHRSARHDVRRSSKAIGRAWRNASAPNDVRGSRAPGGGQPNVVWTGRVGHAPARRSLR